MFALVVLVATLQLTAKDSARTFTVKPQTPIVVTLASNASTGYHWTYDPTTLGTAPGRVVRLVSHRYVPPAQSRPGAAGREIWRFRAVGKGTMGLWLRYVRSWQPNRPARGFGVTIRVR